MNDIVTYTGIFLRILTLIIMVFVVIPLQIQAFQLKDKFWTLKVMLLSVSILTVLSTTAYLVLWFCRLGICMLLIPADALILLTTASSLGISLTLAAIYNHRYLRKEEQ